MATVCAADQFPHLFFYKVFTRVRRTYVRKKCWVQGAYYGGLLNAIDVAERYMTKHVTKSL